LNAITIHVRLGDVRTQYVHSVYSIYSNDCYIL